MRTRSPWYTRVVGAVVLVAVATSAAAAQTAFFNDTTDVVLVDGQSELGAASTYEAVVLFPHGDAAFGRVFNEWTVFLEDKLLSVGPAYVQAFNFDVAGIVEGRPTLAPDVWHHVAFVYDGSEERLYVDGALVATVAAAGGIGNGGGQAHIGAIFRDGVLRSSFTGYVESLRVSRVARYAGASFDPPTGDLPSDDDTVLLLNFDEEAGSPTVQDEGPLGRVGTLATGFEGATAPELGSAPPSSPCPLGPSTWDLWDVARGSAIASTSGFRSGDDAEGENVFGGSFPTPEEGAAFFRDRSDGFVHHVEWETSEARSARSFFLLAAHDQDIVRRAFRTFRLYGFDEGTADFALLYEFDPPLPYGGGPDGNVLSVCFDVPELATSRFRAEFVQEGSGTFFGPRVIELDGFTTPRGVAGGTSTEGEAGAPALALHAPYPNPARGSASVAFDLAGAGAVRLALFDVLGREVAVLVDGVRSGGRHAASVRTDELASGVYVLRLAGDRAVVTRRVVVVR